MISQVSTKPHKKNKANWNTAKYMIDNNIMCLLTCFTNDKKKRIALKTKHKSLSVDKNEWAHVNNICLKLFTNYLHQSSETVITSPINKQNHRIVQKKRYLWDKFKMDSKTYDIFPHCVVEVNFILKRIFNRLVWEQFTNVLYVPHRSVVTISLKKSQHMILREQSAASVTQHH